MRSVLDTNVFISGIFFSGPPSSILKEWGSQSFPIVLSQQILDEYQRVAENLSSRYPSIDISPIIEQMAVHGYFVDTRNQRTTGTPNYHGFYCIREHRKRALSCIGYMALAIAVLTALHPLLIMPFSDRF